jgi:hypothetical protein
MKKLLTIFCFVPLLLRAAPGNIFDGPTPAILVSPPGISNITTAIQTALNQAGTNGAIWLKAGTYNIGSNTIAPLPGQTIYAWGATIYATNCVTAAAALGNIPMMIKPCDNLRVYGGIWTNSINANNTYSCYVGSRTNDPGATNWLFESCRFVGADTDGLYESATNGLRTGMFRNCWIETSYDTVQIFGLTYSNRQYAFENCFLIATNTSTAPTSDHKGISVQGGFVRAKSCFIQLKNSTLGSSGVKVFDDGSGKANGFISIFNSVFDIQDTIASYEFENDADYVSAGVTDPTNIVFSACARLSGDPLRLYFPGADLAAGATIQGQVLSGKLQGPNATGANGDAVNQVISGGQGSGTGRGGAIILQTAPSGSSGSTLGTLSARSYISPKDVTLTESSATTIVNVAIPSGSTVGIRVFATTRANDASDFQVRSDSFLVTAENKAGTVVAGLSTIGTGDTSVAVSTGTLTTTWTAVNNGASVDIKCNAVSSLTQTTLACRWRVETDSPSAPTITAQ